MANNNGITHASFLEEGCAPTFQFLSHPPSSPYLRRWAPLGPGCLNALVLVRKTYAAGVFRLPSCALERSTHGRNDVVVTIAGPETGLQHTCGAETPLDILD